MSIAWVILALCWAVSIAQFALALHLAIPHHPTDGPTRHALRRTPGEDRVVVGAVLSDPTISTERTARP